MVNTAPPVADNRATICARNLPLRAVDPYRCRELEEIAWSRCVDHPIVLVAAHSDDETVGVGSRLSALRRLKLIHLTDGAPRNLDDARREGFSDWPTYAAARQREIDAALASLGASPERIAYGYPDQEAIDHVDALVERLVVDLAGATAVLTHPYEHGHPDHDTAALAVALACQSLDAAGKTAPIRLEFASYHLRQGQAAFGVFWPEPARPEARVALDDAALARKRAAIACHATQRDVLAEFPLSPERLRAAPDYDFAAPAPPKDCLYDGFGWQATSERWRTVASRAWGSRGAGATKKPWLGTIAQACAS